MQAQELIDELKAYHGQKFSNQQLTDYLWFFDARSDDGEEIFRRWKKANPPSGRFPSIAQLLVIADALTLERWQRQKESEPTFKEFAEATSSRSEHGKTALREMVRHLNWDRNDAIDKERGRREYVDWMRSMENRFPNFGWREMAEDLAKWWIDEPNRHEKSKWVMARMEAIRAVNGVYGK